MRQFPLCIFLIALLSSFFACSSDAKLVDKSKTKYGQIKFYIEKSKDKQNIQRIYALVDSSNNTNFYSYYPDRIVKTIEGEKQLTYTVFYGQLPEMFDTKTYQMFSPLDSLILLQGDNILDSLRLNNFKRSKGARAFEIEITYYHGYPKNEKFRP